FLLMLLRTARPTLFPYTTLFRSFDRARTVAELGDDFREGLHLGRDPGHASMQVGELFLRGAQVLELLAEHIGSSHHDIVGLLRQDRKSTRLNSSHVKISYAVFCL